MNQTVQRRDDELNSTQPSVLDEHGDSVLSRVENRIVELGTRLVDRYRRELVEYRGLGQNTVENDMLPLAIRNIRDLLESCRTGVPFGSEEIENFRSSAARRSYQFVSMQSVLHAYRIWGQTVWEAIHEEASRGTDAERNAALGIARSVMEHVDRVSVIVAQAFLEEASGIRRDHNLLRGDFLDALLLGKATTEPAERFLTVMEVELQQHYVVVLFRRMPGEEEIDLRSALATAVFHLQRSGLQESGEGLLSGIRGDEIVVVAPVDTPADYEALKARSREAAGQLSVFVGAIGRMHRQVAGIVKSYSEAHEAVVTGLSAELTGQCLAYSDVLLDNLVRESKYADDLLQEVIIPLNDYDARRGTELLHTLECFYDNRFNLSRAAATLLVRPNTVTYRLERIRDITGYDPAYPDGLLLLSLALKRHRIRRIL
ncbi:PucR family transcriptional regulator [Leucobacter sp. HY1910]